jgi:hypothetical protein
VRALARAAQFEDAAAGDHLAPVAQEGIEHLEQRQQPRLAVQQRDHVDAEHRLQRRLRVEVVQYDLGHLAALELDHDAHAVLVRLVAQLRYAVDLLVAHQVGDALEQPRLVHLVGQLGHDDGLAAALVQFLEARARAHREAAAAALVGRGDLLRTVDDAGGGEVRTRHVLHQAGERDRRIIQQRHAGIDDLAEIVRRDVGGHADGDARGAVDQQVRHPCGQHRRLLLALVVIRREVDGLAVDVGQQFVRQARHPHLGVTHRGGQIAVDRAEIALPVDQQVAHRERLRHAHDGVVDGDVPVRVILADHVADDARGFLVRTVIVVAELAHRVQHAAVHRLESVAHVRQRPPDDDAHRVVQVGLAHLLLEADGHHFARYLAHWVRAASGSVRRFAGEGNSSRKL